MTVRVIVCGSRNWTDEEPIRAYIATLPPGSTVIHGGAQGADAIAAELAWKRGDINTLAVAPDWATFGKSAGPMRNRQMLDMGPSLVRAFRLSGESRGTDDMVRQARAAGVPVEVTRGR